MYFQGEYMDTQEKNQKGSYGKQFVMSPNNVILNDISSWNLQYMFLNSLEISTDNLLGVDHYLCSFYDFP
jgi:hypothetical protein